MTFDELYNKITQNYYKLQQIQSQLDSNERQEAQLIQQIAKDAKQIQLLDDSLSVFKILQEKLTSNHIEHITKLINHALSTVFDDEFTQYQIRIEVSQQRNNNTVQFHLITIENGEVSETLLENNGFGIQSLIGFVLQVYFILQHKQAHILFLDESLTAISTDKLPRLKQFIKEVSRQYNFYFILIAHMESLFELADYSYNVENGKVKLIKGGTSNDN